MGEANQASKIAPVGIQPQAFSFAKNAIQGLAIQPKRIKIVAQMATVAKPISVAKNERKEYRLW